MKKLSFIISMFVLTMSSLNAQDCLDYTEDNNDPDFPGIYGSSDVTIPFDGTYQTVTMGVYGLFDGWSTSGQQNQTIFTFNNGQSASLKYIQENVPMVISGIFIDMDLNPLNDEYLSQSSFDWTSASIFFTGAIDEVIMTQFESGLLFACTEPDFLDDCIDYTEWNSDPSLPGVWLLHGNYTLNYDSTYQEVSMGVYGLFLDWDMDSVGNNAQFAGFIINGQNVSLETIVLNSPYTFNDIVIEIDTNDLSGEYPIDDSFTYFTSGTVTFTGNISEITLGLMEWGMFYSCTEPIVEQEDCIDFTEDNGTPDFPGIYGAGNYTLHYEGSYNEVELGIYGLFDSWDSVANLGQSSQMLLTFDDNVTVSLEYIYNNAPGSFGWISFDLDTTSLGDEFLLDNSLTSGTLYCEGDFHTIEVSFSEVGLLSSCPEIFQPITDCDYVFPGDTTAFLGYISSEDVYFPFDGSDQVIQMGYYDYSNWEQMGEEWVGYQSYFSVNGSDLISIDSIINNQPLWINDVMIELDTTSINQEYNLPNDLTSGTLTFSGEIYDIITKQTGSGIAFICVNGNSELEDCNDYTEDNNDPNAPGIYLIEGNYAMEFDSTHQVVSLGVYGFFDWLNISVGQANQTFFSVNGSDSISLEMIYLNQPYIVNDIEIAIDTTALNNTFPLADFWPSGTVVFVGHISEIVMTQFESGLLFSCALPTDDECECDECVCQIDADFSYVNIGSYYSFVSSGTGTEYSWDFGDDITSNEENPTHEYTLPNIYNVCMTNFNLTDTCLITICKSLEIISITPEANIITPNNDGYDDQAELFCGNVTVYDRNGIIVAKLINQEYWNGTNGNGQVLPMGEYILKCNETDVIRKITVIR